MAAVIGGQISAGGAGEPRWRYAIVKEPCCELLVLLSRPKPDAGRVLAPFPSRCSSGLRGCLVLTVVDASNRPRRRRPIFEANFSRAQRLRAFALEVGARTITTKRHSRTCGLGAPDDFFVLSASAFVRAAEPGRVEADPALAKTQSGGALTEFSAVCRRTSALEADRTNKSAGAATRSWRIWWSCFFGRRGGLGYRSGMRGGGMVARTRSWRRCRSCFEGRPRRIWSCFEGAKLFWTNGAKFGQLAQLLSRGLHEVRAIGQLLQSVSMVRARSGFRMPPIYVRGVTHCQSCSKLGQTWPKLPTYARHPAISLGCRRNRNR